MKSENNKSITISLGSINLTCETKSDLFSPKGLDSGSRLLIEDVIKVFPKYKTVLDWGCGWGAISMCLAKNKPEAKIIAIDSDIAAVSMIKKNLAANNLTNVNVIPSHGYEDVSSENKFDLIVSNPPTHRGREVIDNMIKESLNYLSENGNLVLVVEARLKPWIARSMDESFGNHKILSRNAKHVVVFSHKN
jgi:16S rRNA (guanine1207-N2)-methyltransferase